MDGSSAPWDEYLEAIDAVMAAYDQQRLEALDEWRRHRNEGDETTLNRRYTQRLRELDDEEGEVVRKLARRFGILREDKPDWKWV
jgi:hypothetical protein